MKTKKQTNKATTNTCEWNNAEGCAYQTSCGETHYFATAGIKENDFNFCPFCGKKIKEVAK